jgi:tetratricopeptide (TPR) repeat protein
LCERALALAPTDRPSASELKRSLNGFLQTRAGGPTAGQSATARRLRRVGTLLAVLIAVLGTATAVVVAKRRAGQESAETAADDPLASALAALASPPENTRPERLRTAHKELVAAPKAKTREARDRARAYLALLKAEIALETRSVEDAHSASFALDRVAARIYGEQPGLTLIRVRLALLAKLPSAALKILPRDAPPLLRCKVYAATEEWEHLKKLTTETQDPKTLALAHLHLGRKILKTDAQKARAHFAYAGAAPDHPLRKAIAREAAEHVRSLHRKLWSKIGETSREVEIRKALHMAHAWLVAKEFGEEPTPQDLTNLWDWFFKHGGSLKSKDMALLLALAPENKVYLAAFCYRALREGVADPEFDLPQFQLAIEVAERTPEPPRLVYENMARALEALLRVDELAQFAKRVEERHSKQPELVSCVFAIHGRLLVGLGRHDEALPSLNASIELIPTQSVALYARFVVESARLGDGDVAPPQLLKDGWAWINNNRVDTGKIYRRRVGEALAKLELAASGPSRCADVLDLMLSDVPETLDLAIWRAQVLVAQTPLDTKRLAAALTALKESAAARRIEYQRFFARRPGDLAAHKRGLARLDAIPITGVPRMLRLLADGNLEQLEADLKTLRAAP